MDLIIDRSIWLRGEGSGESFLVRKRDGKQCCLGFLGEACGIAKEDMTNVWAPERIVVGISKVPAFLLDRPLPGQTLPDRSPISQNLMNVNDDEDLPETIREAQIADLFLSEGISVRFIH